MKTIAIAALATVAAFSSQAEARSYAPMRQAGILTCNVDPALGLGVGSVRAVSCSYAFRDGRGRIVRETYVGRMTRAGVDVGLTSGQSMSWNVMTPGGRNRAGMLSGVFGGSSADASIVVGSGTHALVGKGGRAIALQTAAGSGQVGVGVGFGATGLELQKVRVAYAVFN
jgi:hypothetical protein